MIDGSWLRSDSDGVKKLQKCGKTPAIEALTHEDNALQVESGLQKVLAGISQPSTDQIHVVEDPSLEVRDTQTTPHPSRKRRWDKLNEYLDSNKKAKKDAGSTGFSFDEIDRIMPAAPYEQMSKPIPDEKLDTLYGYFPLVVKAFGGIVTGNEAKRLHYILAVLASVCALFDGDARILAEETVVGKRVHGDGAFDFVLQRGDKRVCLVLAKRDDIQQGLAQAYVGSEALAEVEGLTKVYSIVTNFVEWYFSRSLDEKVERTSPITISMGNGISTRKQ